jgi:hypothetical protein
MEPRHEDREQRQALEQPTDPPKKRFRLIRLEERIAPSQGGVTSPGHGCYTGPICAPNGFTTGL